MAMVNYTQAVNTDLLYLMITLAEAKDSYGLAFPSLSQIMVYQKFCNVFQMFQK